MSYVLIGYLSEKGLAAASRGSAVTVGKEPNQTYTHAIYAHGVEESDGTYYPRIKKVHGHYRVSHMGRITRERLSNLTPAESQRCRVANLWCNWQNLLLQGATADDPEVLTWLRLLNKERNLIT